MDTGIAAEERAQRRGVTAGAHEKQMDVAEGTPRGDEDVEPLAVDLYAAVPRHDAGVLWDAEVRPRSLLVGRRPHPQIDGIEDTRHLPVRYAVTLAQAVRFHGRADDQPGAGAESERA